MKKLYILALCGLTAASAAVAASRFKTVKNTPRKIVVKSQEKAPVWRALSDEEYIYEDGEWVLMASSSYKYDSRGNAIEQQTDEDGLLFKMTTEFDEFDKPVTIIGVTKEGDAAEWENNTKRIYTYDPVVHDFFTSRMGYDWEDGEWVQNYYCELNTVTRNDDGNITEIEKSLPMFDQFIPAYKSVWNYDEATGRANEFYYYANYAGTVAADWTLYDATAYKNIVWENTDGQMTSDSFMELVSGTNRVKSADVYYEDEIDGHFFVEYSTEHPSDYFAKETFANPAEIGRTTRYETIDANGSFKITQEEYFDDDNNPTTEPVYVTVETVTIDGHGNIILDEVEETYEGVTEMVDGAKIDYLYDNDGNPTEMILYYYDYDSEEYVPDTKTVYGTYVDASAGVEGVSADRVATDGYTVYNLQGVMVKRVATADSLGDLPAGLYIINGKKQLIR